MITGAKAWVGTSLPTGEPGPPNQIEKKQNNDTLLLQKYYLAHPNLCRPTPNKFLATPLDDTSIVDKWNLHLTPSGC
jgi:hypothetical protein